MVEPNRNWRYSAKRWGSCLHLLQNMISTACLKGLACVSFPCLLFHHFTLLLLDIPGCSGAIICREEAQGQEERRAAGHDSVAVLLPVCHGARVTCTGGAALFVLTLPRACSRMLQKQAETNASPGASWSSSEAFLNFRVEPRDRYGCGGGLRVIYLVGGTFFCPVGTAGRAETGRAQRERDPATAGLDELGSWDGFLAERGSGSATDQLSPILGSISERKILDNTRQTAGQGGNRQPSHEAVLGAGAGVPFGVALVALLCIPAPLGASRPLHSGCHGCCRRGAWGWQRGKRPLRLFGVTPAAAACCGRVGLPPVLLLRHRRSFPSPQTKGLTKRTWGRGNTEWFRAVLSV